MPKSKKGAVVTDLVQGTGGLIIGVIIVFVIISTLLAANLFSGEDNSQTIVNQTVTVTDAGVYFGNYSQEGVTCSIDLITDPTNITITTTNYTVDNCVITAIGDGGINNTGWDISSSNTWNGDTENTAVFMNKNFTQGVDNISSKIPTILLIAAVVLLFGVLVLLVAKSRDMGIGGGQAL